MTVGTALVLLGFGVGALVVAGRPRSSPRVATPTQRDQTEMLRERAEEAQRRSARESQLARDLAAQWSEAVAAARTERS